MTKKDVAEKMRKGIDYQEFLDCRKQKLEQIEYMASMLNVAATIEAMTAGVEPLACVLGAVVMGVDGLVVANLTKEQVLEIVSVQYDYTLGKKNEWLEKVENDPEFGAKDASINAIVDAAKETIMEELFDDMLPVKSQRKVTVH